MEYADRGNLADALRSGRFPCHDFVAVYRCLLDIAAGRAKLLLVYRGNASVRPQYLLLMCEGELCSSPECAWVTRPHQHPQHSLDTTKIGTVWLLQYGCTRT